MSPVNQESNRIESGGSNPAEPLTDWEIALEGSFQRYMTEGQREVMLRLHHRAKAPGLLIDFGCGPGRWTKFLMDRGWQAVCMDIDGPSLARCRAANPTAKVIHSTRDLRMLPVGDCEAALVLCIGVYRVLESDWFLPEVRRVLQPGGLFSGAFFNRFSGRGFYRYTMDELLGGQKSYQQSYGSWRRRVRRGGFEFIHERGYCWFPLPCFSNSPLVPFFTGLEKACGLQRLPKLSPWVTFLAELRGKPVTGRNT
jgi:SAM-dependent methyltransferase